MTRRLFGTDGIRGVANAYPLDTRTVARVGAAVVRVLRTRQDTVVELLVGRDTRESGPAIEAALARGVRTQGGGFVAAGVMPTPGVAWLTSSEGFVAGAVISASHNPYQDNGIKLFSGSGRKLDDDLELAIERVVFDESWVVPESPDEPVTQRDYSSAYLEHASRALPRPERLRSCRVLLDCANGATSHLAPELFRRLGLNVDVIHASPDGRNINRGCGSTAPESLARGVLERGCEVGVAFDGDGDRAILVDDQGRVVDGDGILLACAVHLHATGRLKGDAIVATVMSNLGLEVALRRHGIGVVRCPVGDRAVTEAIERHGLSLGGEQSGHIILTEHLTTGDGLVTALSVLDAMAARGCSLAELVADLEHFPQVLLNVPVREKRNLDEMPAVAEAIRSVERELGDQGRLLVRYSGTEPLLRVMIEGPSQGAITAWADEIASVVRTHLG